ncbi:MAG: class I SAM-dependent methyltransferase [Candidatus Aminicenantes bacterium]|nr:class I SAM-dependent methyltransferase [Candidatus Aminicenantes bacterium]
MKHLSVSLVCLIVLSALVFPHAAEARVPQHGMTVQTHQHDGSSQGRYSKEREEMIERTQPSGKIMDAMGIKPGMVVAEIGAGGGRFAVRLAERVGDAGKVYANDIDPDALEFMKKRCREEKIQNMIVVEGGETDPRLPLAALDVVALVHTLHMVKKPVPLLKNIIATLKPGGVLAVIDADPEKFARMNRDAEGLPSNEQVMRLLNDAGFELVSEHTFLPLHFFWILRPREEADQAANPRE